MPRSFSSGALSIEANSRTATLGLCLCSTLVMALVNDVFPWSTCPMVPMFTCGFERSNFSLDISSLAPFRKDQGLSQVHPKPSCLFGYALDLCDYLFCNILWRLLITLEMHSRSGASLGRRTQIRCVTKHLGQRDKRRDHLSPTNTRL